MNLVLENGLYTADLSPSHLDRILDIGCGPGDWAIQMGRRFPSSDITAIDIGPFDITPSCIPSNVHFLMDDAEEEWYYPSPFSYIHLRFMSGAFSDWSYIYRQAYRNLRPGGILEILDWDYDICNWPGVESQSFDYFSIFGQAVTTSASTSGYPRNTTHLSPPFTDLKSAGFKSITRQTITLPIGQASAGDDPKQITIGKMISIVLLEGVEAQSLRLLTKYGGWSAEGARELCEKVRGELRSQVDSLFLRIPVVVAKKEDDDNEDDDNKVEEEEEERGEEKANITEKEGK
ncbi:putative tam domain methyltransferase [Phaeomoniella chlamydospora]|uniref:Putative tam domain methyltransferase n=1 Tax=Phaeomoniella chlamydospora TaxID=158046 RepID=A0A0G2GQS9_PHACM|nr:putative tam domain methyltransferase [Phaeomoniella chlamydospora]